MLRPVLHFRDETSVTRDLAEVEQVIERLEGELETMRAVRAQLLDGSP